jgi:hypothetical protein
MGLEGLRSKPRRNAPGPERGSAEPRKARFFSGYAGKKCAQIILSGKKKEIRKN